MLEKSGSPSVNVAQGCWSRLPSLPPSYPPSPSLQPAISALLPTTLLSPRFSGAGHDMLLPVRRRFVSQAGGWHHSLCLLSRPLLCALAVEHVRHTAGPRRCQQCQGVTGALDSQSWESTTHPWCPQPWTRNLPSRPQATLRGLYRCPLAHGGHTAPSCCTSHPCHSSLAFEAQVIPGSLPWPPSGVPRL